MKLELLQLNAIYAPVPLEPLLGYGQRPPYGADGGFEGGDSDGPE